MTDIVRYACPVHCAGQVLDATVTAEWDGHEFAFVMESRSGARGSGRTRNPDYATALETLLERLAHTDCFITDISIASLHAMRLAAAERSLPMRFPLVIRPEDNFHAIRVNITEKQRETARTERASDSSGGNNGKRIRIVVDNFESVLDHELLVRTVSMGGKYPSPHGQSRRNNDRNAEIIGLRASGATLSEIGTEFGISRERVRQIVSAGGGPNSQDVRHTQATARQDRLRSDRDAIADDLVRHPNSTLAAIAERLHLSAERINLCLTPAMRSLVDAGSRPSQSRWTNEDVLGILRAAAEMLGVADGSGPLTGPMYNDVRDDLDGPSVPKIYLMFGSWKSAVNAAGLLAKESGRTMQRRFTDEQLLDFVLQYLLDPTAGSRSFAGYDEWRPNNAPHAPSAQLLRARLGRWQVVRAKAWQEAGTTGLVTSADLLATSRAHRNDLDGDQLWAADEVLRSVETNEGNPGDPVQYDLHLFPDAPSSAELIQSFGTWGLALGALGWDPTALARKVQRQSRDEALEHLRRFVQSFEGEHGRLPTAREWQLARDLTTTLGPWAYVRSHGTWDAAVQTAACLGPEPWPMGGHKVIG